MDDEIWRLNAGCRGLDPAVMFPSKGDDDAVANAKAICLDCPVESECREAAIAGNEPYGIWGGLTEDERKSVRRRRQRLALRAKAVGDTQERLFT